MGPGLVGPAGPAGSLLTEPRQDRPPRLQATLQQWKQAAVIAAAEWAEAA